jgi:DNA mismatch endonuclease (patch repair protein)
MQSVGTKNTGPEIALRKLLHRLGFRFRLHIRSLPGRPDIVLAGRKTAIFVHGCYWHGHGCSKGRLPKSRLDYWGPKIAANRERDAKNLGALKAKGWKVILVWQCELLKLTRLEKKLLKRIPRL